MPEYKALLVDFNGTLAESRGPEDELLLDLGSKYSGVTVERTDFEKYWGCGLKEFMTQVMKDKGVKDYEKAGSACVAEYFGRFDEVLERSRLINPCTSKIVGALRTKMKVAIVSSAEARLVERASEYFGIDSEFDLIVGMEEWERAKPEPDVYLRAISELGVDAKDAVAVDDTPRGIRAAKAAGVGRIIGIRNTKTYAQLKEAGADEVIDSINELLNEFC